MEEKLSDHGLDHPFFLYLILIINFISVGFSLSAFATSFGPIPLVEQIEHAPYAVRGFIESRWVDMDKESQRPSTYWKFRIEEQLNGPDLGTKEITLMQPGGEMNGIGYNVPSHAEFSEGEHAVVLARPTHENGVLEVYGLASGKYTVVDTDDNSTNIKNGLGPIVADANGRALTLDEFKKVFQRVREHDTSPQDLGIVVNRDSERDHDHAFAATAIASALPPGGPGDSSGGVAAKSQSPSTLVGDKQVTNREPSSEKSSTGLPEDTWTKLIAIALALGAFLLVTIFFVRKPNK